MSHRDTMAFLRSIGCEGHAGDLGSIRFAEKVIAGDRRRIAKMLEDRAVEVADENPVLAAELSLIARGIKGGDDTPA